MHIQTGVSRAYSARILATGRGTLAREVVDINIHRDGEDDKATFAGLFVAGSKCADEGGLARYAKIQQLVACERGQQPFPSLVLFVNFGEEESGF